MSESLEPRLAVFPSTVPSPQTQALIAAVAKAFKEAVAVLDAIVPESSEKSKAIIALEGAYVLCVKALIDSDKG